MTVVSEAGGSTRSIAGTPQGLVLTLASMFPVMGVVLLSPVAVKMQEAFVAHPDGSAKLAAIALTAPALSIAFLAPFAGYLVDRIGRRPAMLMALVVYAVLGLMPLLLDHPYLSVASRFALGAAEAVILAAKFSFLSAYYSGEDRDRWIAYTGTAVAIGATCFYLGGGALGEISWKAPFMAYGFALPIALLVALVLFEPPVAVASAETAVAKTGPSGEAVRSLVVLLAITVLGAILYYIVPLQLAHFLVDRGVTTPAAIGTYIALSGLGNPIGAYSFRHLRLVPTGSLMTVSFAIAAAGLGFAVMVPGPTALAVGAFVNQLGCGLFIPAAVSAMLRLAPPGRVGTSGGIWQTCFFVGQFLSPLVVLQTIESGGVGHALYLLALANLVFAFVCIAGLTVAGLNRKVAAA